MPAQETVVNQFPSKRDGPAAAALAGRRATIRAIDVLMAGLTLSKVPGSISDARLIPAAANAAGSRRPLGPGGLRLVPARQQAEPKQPHTQNGRTARFRD